MRLSFYLILCLSLLFSVVSGFSRNEVGYYQSNLSKNFFNINKYVNTNELDTFETKKYKSFFDKTFNISEVNEAIFLETGFNIKSSSNFFLDPYKEHSFMTINPIQSELFPSYNINILQTNLSYIVVDDNIDERPISSLNSEAEHKIHDSTYLVQRKYIFRYNQLEPVPLFVFQPEKRKINLLKVGFITAATAGTVAVLHYHQSRAWWQQTRTNHFHFQNDWEYALWIDKLGHWWGATGIQHLFSSSLSWANFSDEASVIIGSVLALTYQLYVETYDAYASNWGFSPGDALFDFGGAVYPLIQYYYPPLKNVNLKLSYFPSKRLLKKDPNDELYRHKFIIDDYEGQSFYLSFKVNNMLPKSLEKIWPDFLCIAIGYQMRNWGGYADADKNYFFALDYDLEQIPLYGNFWQFLKKTFNHFHLPAPALRISNKKITLTIAY